MDVKDLRLPDDCFVDWLSRYIDWVTPTTEGAYEGMFAVGSVVLSAAIGRNVYTYYGYETYPNLFVLLIGKSGVTRKSTLMRRGRDLQALTPGLKNVRVARSIGSGEGLLQRFCEPKTTGNGRNTLLTFEAIPGQRVILDETEFTNILKKARRSGTANIPEILQVLWDLESWSPTTRQGSIEVVDPFFCMVSATTPSSLSTIFEEKDVETGLMPRIACFFCHPREPIAKPPPPDPVVLNELAQGLEDIHQWCLQFINKAIEFSPAASRSWNAAYKDFKRHNDHASDILSTLMNRVHTYAVKWAILYAMQAGHTQIEDEDIQRGILVGQYLEKAAEFLPGQFVKNSVANIEERYIEMMRENQGNWFTFSQIHKKVGGRIKSADLMLSLETLVLGGVLEKDNPPEKKMPIYRVA